MARHQTLFDAWKHADLLAEGPPGRFARSWLDEAESTLLRLAPEWRLDSGTAGPDRTVSDLTTDPQLAGDVDLAGSLGLDAIDATTDQVADQITGKITGQITGLASPTMIVPGGTTTLTNPEDLYIISDWPATQTSRIRWSPDNVVFHDDGSFDLILRESPDTVYRPYTSGEVATKATASHGLWEWNVQIPDMVSGSVFGMFLFQADASTRRIEYDLEFVGSDTDSLEINIHMQDDTGRMHRLIGGPITVDLPFDAAEGMHSYEIEVLENEVVFRADGQEIGRFGPEDMPQGVWRTGELRAYTDLWAVSPGGQEYWAGVWPNPTEPLVAKVGLMDGPADDGPLPDPVPEGTILGTLGADDLSGTDDDDRIDGLAGDDTITAGIGKDTVLGGLGDDRITLDFGADVIDGGAGEDWLFVAGDTKAVVDLARSTAQQTGYGTDTILGVEHILGGRGHDNLSGTDAANRLDGGAGNDRLAGRAGADVLTGGLGRDRLDGGVDADADVFVFRTAAESAARRGDAILNFGEEDLLDLTGLSAQVLTFSDSGAGAFAVWTKQGRLGTEVLADTTGDGRADFQVTLWDGFTLRASDVLL